MKNPWMSLWLSAANQAAGTARAFWTAEAARQQKAWVKAATQSPARPTRKKARGTQKKG